MPSDSQIRSQSSEGTEATKEVEMHQVLQASLDEAIEHQNAQVQETILRSKVDALPSENDVVWVRSTNVQTNNANIHVQRNSLILLKISIERTFFLAVPHPCTHEAENYLQEMIHVNMN